MLRAIYALYDYIVRCLHGANSNNNIDKLEEVARLPVRSNPAGTRSVQRLMANTEHLQRVDDLVQRSGQCTQLANVLLMTQRMVTLAGDGHWDAVAALEVERRSLLSETFSEPVPPEHSEIFPRHWLPCSTSTKS